MFEKSPFHAAMRDLEKAEKELDRQRSKLPEVDAVIAGNVAKRDALSRKLEELHAEDGPLDSIVDALAELGRERDALNRLIADSIRFKEIRIRRVAEATVAVLAAEANAHTAQAKHYAEQESEAIARALAHCLPFIRELQAAASAAEYHRNLSRGDSYARGEAYAVDGVTLLVNEIGKLEQGNREAFDIEKPKKGSPPILAVQSRFVVDEDRRIAEKLIEAGQLDREGNALLAAQREAAKVTPMPREKVDMNQADMAMFNLRQSIERLEMEIVAERTRELPIGMGYGNPENARRRNLERMQKALERDREALANWESKIKAAAA